MQNLLVKIPICNIPGKSGRIVKLLENTILRNKYKCKHYTVVKHGQFSALTRDRPKLIFINSAETETGPKYSNVVSAENETEAEFYILFTAETETENQ